MAELLGVVTKATSSFLELNQVSIDNWAFKLFYKFSTTILVFCSVLTTAKQFFGSPIQCDGGSAAGGVEKDVLESYCWMYSTWNVPPQYKGACSRGMDLNGVSVEEWNQHRTSIVYNSYYQWVPLYLIFLAVIFYLPRLCWMMMEGGLMEFFGKGTTTRFIEDQEEKKETLVNFFCKNIHNKYNIYFFGFISMEVLNELIVLIQFAMTHTFLHYRFMGYGIDVLKYYRMPEEEQMEHKNPMCNTFPRIASCDYWRWGPGGQQENVNAVCVLTLNMIHDKAFLILWWWFFFLAIMGLIRLIYRLCQILSPELRFQLINMRMNRYFKKSTKIVKIEHFVSQCKLGDWFVLYQLSKNINRPFFMDFLIHLSTRYAHGHVCDEEDPDEDGPLLEQMNHFLKPSNKAKMCNGTSDEKGDNVLEMMTKPKITLDEPDAKEKKEDDGGDDDDDDDDDEEDEEEEEEQEKKGGKKSKKSEGGEERIDLPLGDDIDSALSRRKVEAKEPGSAKSSKSKSSAKSGGKSRKH